MLLLKRFFLFFISLGILFYVIYFTTPPKSWADASIIQILEFFLPLLFSITFLVDLFFDFLPRSFSIGLGGMVLVTLESVGQFNILTVAICLAATILLATSFKKPPLREQRAKSLPEKKELKQNKLRSKLLKFKRRNHE